MAENNIVTHILTTAKSASDWKNSEYTPLNGEIILYKEADAERIKVKIGNGTTKVDKLPFSTLDIDKNDTSLKIDEGTGVISHSETYAGKEITQPASLSFGTSFDVISKVSALKGHLSAIETKQLSIPSNTVSSSADGLVPKHNNEDKVFIKGAWSTIPLENASYLTGTLPTTKGGTGLNLTSVNIGKSQFLKSNAVGNVVEPYSPQASIEWNNTVHQSSTDVPTVGAVYNFVQAGFEANDAMVFKGFLKTNATVSEQADKIYANVPAPSVGYSAGWTYKVLARGTYAGQVCEINDVVIAVRDSKSTSTTIINDDWVVVQGNVDGALVEAQLGTTPTAHTGYIQSALYKENSKLYVDVNTTIDNHYAPEGGSTTSASGGIATSGNTVDVITGIVNDNKGHITGIISGKATDTTYSVKANSGLTMTGTVLSHTNAVTADTAGITSIPATISGYGSQGSLTIPNVKYDAQGHITGVDSKTVAITMPAFPTMGLGLENSGATIKHKAVAAKSEDDAALGNVENNYIYSIYRDTMGHITGIQSKNIVDKINNILDTSSIYLVKVDTLANWNAATEAPKTGQIIAYSDVQSAIKIGDGTTLPKDLNFIKPPTLATSVVPGVAKLYNALGASTDGAPTLKLLQDSIDSIKLSTLNNDGLENEVFIDAGTSTILID